MKRTGWHWLAGSFFCLVPSIVQAQTPTEVPMRCATFQLERILQQRNPGRLQQINELNQRIQKVQAEYGQLRRQADTTIYLIPVVVHIIHSTASGQIGGESNGNISDDQVLSQIQILNEDYRRKAGTNGYNTSSIGADAGIEFFLATTDPNGKPSTGITRHYYANKSSFDVLSYEDDLLLSTIAYWPSDRYLNIWVTKVDNNNLGFTPQYPTITKSDTLQGLPVDTDKLTDGVIVDYRAFGKQTVSSYYKSYALGRTATHEIGHWLGLFHPDGPYDDPCGDDYIADTPPTDNLNQTSSCTDIYSNCSGKRTRELIENYMMYSPDACMNMFTAGQVARMRTVLAISPSRANLFSGSVTPITETEKLTINVYPNPTTTDPLLDVQLKGNQSFTVGVFDTSGRLLRTVSYADSPSTRLSLSINGLATGLYIVRVKTSTEMVSKRLLVQ
ncbi:M43 family zinc metalloprotease [Spirosoma sp. KNUC1025]|uniref:M43 family zinc metalloprotease n=1 Tax=Spirosoma sp. KNUC1025 TaxID=2894082 RepID=UPI0038664697|nr:T9SS type A sorting domain-containing protein [Spirosoma sp. KNUC1025]